MSRSRVRYRELFELFLQAQRSVMFTAFLAAATPFHCERCDVAFDLSEEDADEDDEVLCRRCRASGRERR